MVMSDRWRMSPGLRRVSAALAVVALAIGGAKVASDHTMPGNGFSTMQTAAADPTGPTGGPSGGPGGMNGSQFQPPGLPPQMPDYQGGINQPPLDQNSGISIYNSGNPQAPQQVPGQQAGQQTQPGQQPAHGTQIPDYQTATPYTEGPGKANPDYQAPQQQSPQHPQQGQQPSQAPTQTEQPQEPTPTESPREEPNSKSEKDSTQEQERDEYKCLSNPPVMKFVSMKGQVHLRLAGGGGCENCKEEQPKEKPNDCGTKYVSNVGIRAAAEGVEGGKESIMIFYTDAARSAGTNSGAAILSADKPEELREFPATIAPDSKAAYDMWGEIACHAQASQLTSPSDPSKSLNDRLTSNRDSVFQQFLCHFYGAPKKFWDGPGGRYKESWNLEWARPAIGTFAFARSFCNP